MPRPRAARRMSSIGAKMDPAKLWVISEHKINIANQVIKEGGGKLKKEYHGGARKAYGEAKKATRAK